MEEITVSESVERSSYITYLYNAVMGEVVACGGTGELLFEDDRTALRIRIEKNFGRILIRVRELVAEIIGIGYKYGYLQKKLSVCLSRQEKRLLSAALIAADYESDRGYLLGKMAGSVICIDGLYTFRLAPLREKWARIISYVPDGFSSADLKKFCEFLVGESRHKIYVRGSAVYGENFVPLRRSRLTGQEDACTEIMLSDAGFVYCLGEVEGSVGDFLQKYYAERAIFS